MRSTVTPVWVIASWASVAVWMVVIFALSAQTGTQSSGLSDTVASLLRSLTAGALDDVAASTLHLVVRKAAHFGAYALLGGLTALAWWVTRHWRGQHRGRLRRERLDRGRLDRGRKGGGPWSASWVGPFLIAVAYAASDEAHQLLVAGRAGQITDVLIDSAGAAVGIGIALLIVRRRAHARP